MIIEHSFADFDSNTAPYSFTRDVIKWFVEQGYSCRGNMESGKEKYNSVFASTILDVFGVDITSEDILVNGTKRVKYVHGDGWAFARVFRDSWCRGSSNWVTACQFYFWFEDNVMAMQFKLAML